ncbi:polyprenyl synthetase family protein [Inquilinus limosus]|uniref:polyprenyl synthetase family protein n=1 Tax=Inquilinus limosus TaxID=171674 RepID=UPI003F18B6AB
MAETGARVEQMLDRLLPGPEPGEPPLVEAMRYATLGGGKRLRPFLVMATSRLFDVAEACALRTAAAIEMLHCYSLVHDDLPAMDDDDLRRGRPTTHRAFDEATAILAGDALLTLAFEVLADPGTHAEADVRIALVAGLAQAAGAAGMVGGQALDMQAERNPSADLDTVIRLHRLKTGALFEFSCEAGAILGKADHARRAALRAYARDMGLAFQIGDDLLDVRGRAEEMGKAPGRDAAAGKATFVTLLGLDQAEARARLLADQACRHLDVFGSHAGALRAVARFVVDRRS